MTIWFTSDWHFGHKNIMTFCPQRLDFLGLSDPTDVDQMNLALVRLWNATVAPEDEVFFPGDACMGKLSETLTYIGELNGLIHLFWGNHDRPHPAINQGEKQDKWIQTYADAGFHTQRLDGFYNFPNGYTALINHFPYEGDSDEGGDRYPAYRPEDSGFPLVHGHVHDMWQVRGRQINVGLDAWGRLLSEDEVADLVEQSVVGLPHGQA